MEFKLILIYLRAQLTVWAPITKDSTTEKISKHIKVNNMAINDS
jgi:hypothetical protein